LAGRRRRFGVLPLCALLAVAFAALYLGAATLGPLRELETAVFDFQLRLRGPLPPGRDIAIVMVDERSIAALGGWPLSRERYADLVDALDRAGARVIGFDILFAEPEAALPSDIAELVEGTARRLGLPELDALAAELRERPARADAHLAAAIGRYGRVVLPFVFRFDPEAATLDADPLPPGTAYATVRAAPRGTRLPLQPSGLVLPIPPLAKAAAALGHAVLAFDVDGAPRFDYPVLEHDLDYLPSAAVRIAQLYRGVPWDEVRVELGRGIAIGASFLPTDAAMRAPVNYRGPAETYPTYSFVDVLQGEVAPEALRDKVVLVGASLFGARDMVETPFTSVLPGVERLATIVDSILRDDYLRRPTEAPLGEALAIVVASFAVGLAVAYLPISASALATLALLVALFAVSHLLLTGEGLWFFVVLPEAAVVVIYVLAALYRHGLLDREHRAVRAAFGRYLAPKMIERLLARPERLRLGGDLRELTVLFCDIRSSTAIGELLDPERLTRVLNGVLTPLSDIVLEHNGTIAKFTGDGFLAFWNAPVEEPRHAELAARAALAMAAAVPEINARLAEDLPFALRIGVAINTGLSVVGNFGTARRFDYSAMGDAVNVAARLQDETKTYGIDIALGAATAARLPGFATLPLDLVHVRGRAQPVELYALLGDETMARTEAFRRLEATQVALTAALRGPDRGATAALAAARQAFPPCLAGTLRLYAARLAEAGAAST
jgi:adenylate cyclase